MRKLLISVLIIILFVIAGYMCYDGLTVMNYRISGIKEIKEFNEGLDTQINVISKLISYDYPTELSNLSKSLKELKTEKENYDNMVSISTDEQVQKATKFEKYEIETLWVMLGNHAKKEGVTIKMDLSASSIGTPGLYNLNFTVKGQYIGIADFIHDIENDSKLGFEIENFKLLPEGDENELTGTFTCKDITINIDSANASYQNESQTTGMDTTSNDSNDTTDNSSDETINNSSDETINAKSQTDSDVNSTDEIKQ